MSKVTYISASQSGGPRTGAGPWAIRCRSADVLKKKDRKKCQCMENSAPVPGAMEKIPAGPPD